LHVILLPVERSQIITALRNKSTLVDSHPAESRFDPPGHHGLSVFRSSALARERQPISISFGDEPVKCRASVAQAKPNCVHYPYTLYDICSRRIPRNQKVQSHETEIAVVGAGIVGIATAYYLAVQHKRTRLLILDQGQPMTLTSAQSGENYRNWWPHPIMTAFTNHSITLMEDIARKTDNRLHMTRRGYLLCSRDVKPDALMRQLYVGYGTAAEHAIRIHESKGQTTYQPPASADWKVAPSGVDVLRNNLIRKHFPDLDPAISTILHIRRAGDISGQQLGQYMLEEIRAAGGRFQRGRVTMIENGRRFKIAIEANGQRETVNADFIVNAAGPFASHVALMLGETLPLLNVLQQKIAFPDRLGAIPRQMPFTIDLDGQTIAWTPEERDALGEDPSIAKFIKPMPGNIHCRPDGGEHSQWIKLGWAYNATPSEPEREPALDPNFPEIVVRAACRMFPRLRPYIGALPRGRSHYGGYYPMTAENWPILGASHTPGVFHAAALSGYGTMSACAAGDICARSLIGAPVPQFARSLSLARYGCKELMDELERTPSRGLL
jgi:glycine/D-amino acid oxidase-like deaminating enzyme